MKAAALEDNDWPEDAVSTIVALSLRQSIVTADDLSREMPKPPHPNMAGAAFAAARTLGFIEAVGYQISINKSRKHGVIRTWRRRINKGVGQ
ncbi:hypothetical protein ACFVWT_04545 [Arthrobacter sp. NPDC058288]|uniref:hypothetical protein n=1 Tax=Arthrobacter sp. NPDC058288 TaxID=3346424 RepID=UPI0036DFF50B